MGLGLRLAVPVRVRGSVGLARRSGGRGAALRVGVDYTRAVALATDRYEAYVLPPVVQAAGALLLAIPGALLYGLDGAVIGITGVDGARRDRYRRVGGARAGALRVEQPKLLRRAISFGLKSYAANGLQLLNYRVDVFILATVASAVTVGQYSVAFTMTSVLWLLPSALAGVLFPRVAHLDAQEGRTAAEQLEMVETKSVRHATIVSLGGAAFVALALLFLVVPIFGSEFRPATELGLILLPGLPRLGLLSSSRRRSPAAASRYTRSTLRSSSRR